MIRLRTLCAITVVAAFVSVLPAANAAPAVHFVAAGSSALFQGFEISTVNDLPTKPALANHDFHHYTFKSANCPGASCVSVLRDPRTNPSAGPIPDEPSNVWIVWACPNGGGSPTATEVACPVGTVDHVWLYHQVDSTVGVRSFFARDAGGTGAAVRSIIDSSSTSSAKSAQAVSATLLLYGIAGPTGTCTSVNAGGGGCDDQTLPAEVQSVVNNVQVTAGMTDIRAEDAKAATKRANGPVTNNVSLGYGTVGSQLVGSSIHSSFSVTNATPVEFGLQGLPDPFNNVVVPSTITSFPVGESPILFIANRKNASGLGAGLGGAAPPYAYTDVEDGASTAANHLAELFSATDCSGQAAAFQDAAGAASFGASGLGANFPITLIQREPLSGTMNTTEWSEFRTRFNYTGGGNYANPAAYPHVANEAGGFSQEYNVSPTADNTSTGLNKNCNTANGVTGTRRRAIGTGELVKGVLNTTDSLGYAFFSFGNVSSIGLSANYGYLTIDSVDPIFATYANGQLPKCTPGGAPNCSEGAGSIWGGGPSFPNLRNGTYRAWSLLRMYCDIAAGNHCLATDDNLGAEALLALAQADISGGGANSSADYLPFGEAQYVRAHYNLLGGTQHAQPFVHFFDQAMINPSPATNDTLDVASSGTESDAGFANGGDAGACIIPINFASTSSSGNNANDTVLQVTKGLSTQPSGVVYNYTLVSGTSLTALAAKGLPIQVSITGFAGASPAAGAFDGVYSVKLSSVSGTQFKAVNNNPANGASSTIAPSDPNASAGNGNSLNGTNVATQCFQ